MKSLMSSFLVAILLLLIGCGSSEITSKYDYMAPNTDVNNNFGYLRVFTDQYKENGIYGEDPSIEVHKGYSIYLKNGDLLMNIEKYYGAPETVRLIEGEYVVIAELHKSVVQSFVVSIEKGKILEIDKSMVKNPIAME